MSRKQTKVLVPKESTADRLNASAGTPAVQFEFIQPFKLALVRVLRTYLQALIGLVTLGMAGGALAGMPLDEFWKIFVAAAGTAVAPAAVSLLQNLLEVMGGWDETKPELRG